MTDCPYANEKLTSQGISAFRSSERVQENNAVILGPFTFGLHQIWVSFVSSIIVVPPNLLIDFLFRKSRPRPNRVHPITCKGNSTSGFFACFRLHAWSQKINSKALSETNSTQSLANSPDPSPHCSSAMDNNNSGRFSIQSSSSDVKSQSPEGSSTNNMSDHFGSQEVSNVLVYFEDC